MKFFSPVNWLNKVFAGERKAKKLLLLQQQRTLLHRGFEGTAEVMGASLPVDKAASMLPVRLWLKLKRPDGSFIYTHTCSLLSLRQVPVKGQVVRIKYLPENLSSVLVL